MRLFLKNDLELDWFLETVSQNCHHDSKIFGTLFEPIEFFGNKIIKSFDLKNQDQNHHHFRLSELFATNYIQNVIQKCYTLKKRNLFALLICQFKRYVVSR